MKLSYRQRKNQGIQQVMIATIGLVICSGTTLVYGEHITSPECRFERPVSQEPVPTPDSIQSQAPVIDVVFVLDTTGSMGGLIEGAKQKIWSIASAISQAQGANSCDVHQNHEQINHAVPRIRFGLVGYRDRGDEYVTLTTPLTQDLDAVYADLMQYQARGGGDTPESVNEAVFQAVERFEWSTDEHALKLIYLVGDAPPQMDYKDDVKYHASCRLAYEQRININTIQCGNTSGTKAVWEEIAQLANGAYAAIEQSGGTVAISTPYDQQIAQYDHQLRNTMISYGDSETHKSRDARRARANQLSKDADLEAAADRAIYNQSSSGEVNLYGHGELIVALEDGSIEYDSIDQSQLPADLQELTQEELKTEIERRKKQRSELSNQIKELAKKRNEYIRQHAHSAADSFDAKVLKALKEQGGRVGIRFENKETSASADLPAD